MINLGKELKGDNVKLKESYETALQNKVPPGKRRDFLNKTYKVG